MAAAMRVAGARLSKDIWRFSCYSTVSSTARETSDVTQSSGDVVYPPIKEKYPPGNWSEELAPHQSWHWYNEGQALLDKEDVRERLETIAGDKPKKMSRIQNWDEQPRTLDYKRFVTRSHMVKGLPDIYNSINVDTEYKILKPVIMDHLLHSNFMYKQFCKENNVESNTRKEIELSSSFWGLVLHSVFSGCAMTNTHLLRAQISRDVRLETFWRAWMDIGQVDTENDKTWRRVWLQYKDNATYQIRTEKPLPEFVPADDALCTQGDYPEIDYPPQTLGQHTNLGRPITVSGHWVGDPCEFSPVNILQLGFPYFSFARKFHDKPHLIEEAVTQAGLISSFGSCVAQAHNQGFNVYFDVTYPFTTQTFVTDGTTVQPFAYQLNTLHMWQPRTANPKNNILWVGDRLKLFDKIEDGKIHGFNDEAFVQFLRAVLLKPVDCTRDLRPYLPADKAPLNKHLYINQKGDDPIEHPKIGRFQYPRHTVYF